MNKNSNNSSFTRKGYSKLAAQIAKGAVKKKILTINHSGARAADEILDGIMENHKKTSDFNGFDGGRSENTSYLELTAKRCIERNRAKWRNFLIELVSRFDHDAISCFGVNFVYGGLLTASVSNIGWASVIEIGANREGAAKIALETVMKGKARGNMVWIIKGRELLSPEMRKIYLFNPECAFILNFCPSDDGDLSQMIGSADLSKLKNILILIPESCKRSLSCMQNHRTLYAVTKDCPGSCALTGFSKGEGDRIRNGEGSVRSELPRGVWSFLESPSLPIYADGMEDLFDDIENFISGGKSRRMPRYIL
jgi:hypothetical protein